MASNPFNAVREPNAYDYWETQCSPEAVAKAWAEAIGEDSRRTQAALAERTIVEVEGIGINNTCLRMDGDHAAHGYARVGQGCYVYAPNTPAEHITGISDRAAAALDDVAELRRLMGGLADMGMPDLSGMLDRIEAALREGRAS